MMDSLTKLGRDAMPVMAFQFLEGDHLKSIQQKTRKVLERGVHRDCEGPQELIQFGQNRRYKDTIADGATVMRYAPELFAMYGSLLEVVQLLTGDEYQLSPWLKSAVVAKRCVGKGAEHGWHHDYNDAVAIVYLTEGEPLEVLPYGMTPDTPGHEAHVTKVAPIPGRVAILRGRNHFHRVARHNALIERDVVVYNFYLAGEGLPERPPLLDRTLFSGT